MPLCVADAVRKTKNQQFKGETDTDIEALARRWLVNSRDRGGGRHLRNKGKSAKSRHATHTSDASTSSTTPTTKRRGKEVTMPVANDGNDTSDDDLFDDVSDCGRSTQRRCPSPSVIGTYDSTFYDAHVFACRFWSCKRHCMSILPHCCTLLYLQHNFCYCSGHQSPRGSDRAERQTTIKLIVVVLRRLTFLIDITS